MGRSKGGKYFKPPRNRRPGQGPDEEGSEGSEGEDSGYQPRKGGLGGQSATAGMLPPSGSEDEDEEEASEKPAPKAQGGQSKTAGLLPPNSSDEEEDSEEESESDDDQPVNEYLSGPRQPKKQVVVERDPEDIRKDIERLELIRKKREDDRKKRIADEGWDRFAPISETNKPPGHVVPADHPSRKGT